MIFNSISFALFFPAVILIYFLLSPRRRNAWLLLSSYLFYMYHGAEYALLLSAITLISYISGILMEKADGKCGRSGRKALLLFSCILTIAPLLFFKYAPQLSELTGISPGFSLVLPVGISFYTFQALGYIADVYRGSIAAERSFLRYALFLSFFPQILSGPIARAGELIGQFDEVHQPDYERIRHGLFRMFTGYFIKICAASRLSIVSELIFSSPADMTGYQLLLGLTAYALQIYCDFSSYSMLAAGSAEVMGFKLRENFFQPFFSDSCSELWRRWHMSLNDFLKDYIYIPLGGSRKGLIRKYINLLTVFTVSGIWHGSGLTYPLWGLSNGVFQIVEDLFSRVLPRKLSLRLPGLPKSVRVLRTFLLFLASLVFFRAENTEEALLIYQRIIFHFEPRSILTTSVFSLGLGVASMLILTAVMAAILIYDILNEKTSDAAAAILSLRTLPRWAVYYLLAGAICLSAGIGAEQFIYFKF